MNGNRDGDAGSEPCEMGISIGRVGDLLWCSFPELRDELYEMVKVAFERAIDYDLGVSQLSVLFLCQLLHDRIVRPGIEQDDLELLRRGLRVVREILTYHDGPPPWGLYGDGLWHGLISHIRPSDLVFMRRADPHAVREVKDAFNIGSW